ncbi:MAG: DUF3131 domain-containing protein [Campylobacterota bacterium]|nr:DUF3131 domain-containing protein [Campylobacterota bacterium]
MVLRIFTFTIIVLCLFSSPLNAFWWGKDETLLAPTHSTSPCQLRSTLTVEELKMAKIAWKYIENNFNEKTGLTAAAHKFPSAATWDWANAIFAIYAARKFNFIDQERYEKMMNKFLKTMQKMELFNNELPNKTYNVNSTKMTDYVNKVKKEGTGWSAADLARLLAALNLVEQCEENLAPQVEKLTLRYRYCRTLSVEGDLYGGTYHNGKLDIRHEALTGYEEYLARGYELWEHNASEARRYKFVKEVDLYGIKIPTDTRPFFSNFVESEPFWYLGFEYGLEDPESSRYIKNIYKVQEERYKRTGQLTAVTEDNIDTSPYFLFNTIYTHGEAWKTINQKGEDYDDFKAVSTKAGIGMRYLFDTPYANKVFNYLKNNNDEKKGFYAGIYEKRPGQNKAMTLNTNAIILESILSAKMGPLQKLNPNVKRSVYDNYRDNVNNFRCLPSEKKKLVLEPYHPSIKDINRSQDINKAKIAWQYFEKNYNASTGLVNSLHTYTTIKPEHIGKTIMATISAHELEIIDSQKFHQRMDKLLNTIQNMKLYNNELPNLYYNAKDANRVTKSGHTTNTGNGWDLYSIAHMLTGLYYLERDYPIYNKRIYGFVSKWNFKRAIMEKKMQNRYFDGKAKGGFTSISDPAKEYYIYNALNLFNIKSYSHLYDDRNLDYKAIYNYEVPMGYKHKIANAESYLWSMLEHPHFLKYKHYSSNLYLALKDKYINTNKIATSSEEALDRKPYWIQNTLYNNGRLWSDLKKDKKTILRKNIISTKASFIYNALYGYTDDYTKVLNKVLQKSYIEDKGWFGGLYAHSKEINRSLNLMTNAAVLESLYYRKIGNFYYAKDKNLYDKIALHHYKKEDIYYLKSKEIALRYDAGKAMENFSDQSQPLRIMLTKSKNFVLHVGMFDSENSAQQYMSEHNISTDAFTITLGDIDSDKFLLSNKYYEYNYHIPYKNKNIDYENVGYAMHSKEKKSEKKNFSQLPKK